MAQSKTQRSFVHGEITPELHGRSDLVQFQGGLAGCRNFIVLRYGGLANRTGSKYVGTVKYPNRRTYLQKFVFSPVDSFLIEVGHEYFRFFAGGAAIGAPYELATPYQELDLATLRFAQSANIVTITHPNYQPRELARLSNTNWTLTPIVTAPSISAPTGLAVTPGVGTALPYRYQVTAVQADTYEESLPSAAVTVNCDQPSITRPNELAWIAVTGAVEYNIYCDRGDGNGLGFIGVTTGLSFSDVGYIPDQSYPPPSARVLFDSTGNFPRTAGYYQQRLLFASTSNESEKIWASRIAAFKNFTVSSPIQDNDAVTWVNAGAQVNAVQHLLEMDRLYIFTASNVWYPRGDDTGTLTPEAIYPTKIGLYGAAEVVPVIAGRRILYVRDQAQQVRSLDTRDGNDEDLTLFASHLFDVETIRRMDYAERPHSLIYAVRSDGALLTLTWVPDHGVIGWARHDSGNDGDGGHCYEDVCVVQEGTEDAVYVMAVRKVGTTGTARYIERFSSRRSNPIFLDSYLSYSGPAVTTFGGLGHLEGRTVNALADGSVTGPYIVTAGTVTLPVAASTVHAGLPFTSDLETLDLDSAEAELRDRKKNLKAVSVLVSESRSLFAGPSFEELYEYKPSIVAYNTPPSALNELIEIPITSSWRDSGRIVIRHTDPLPLKILAVIPNGDIGG